MQFNKFSGLLWLCLCLPISGWALETDNSQPIKIEADHFLLDESKGVTIYTGNVVVIQGSLKIEGNEVTIYDNKGKAEKIVAVGSPVKFRQQPQGQDEPVRGESQQAEYLLNQDTIVLIDQATLWQQDNTFSSDRIVYDSRKSLVKAGSKTPGTDRVQVTLEPAE